MLRRVVWGSPHVRAGKSCKPLLNMLLLKRPIPVQEWLSAAHHFLRKSDPIKSCQCFIKLDEWRSVAILEPPPIIREVAFIFAEFSSSPRKGVLQLQALTLEVFSVMNHVSEKVVLDDFCLLRKMFSNIFSTKFWRCDASKHREQSCLCCAHVFSYETCRTAYFDF